MRNPYATGNWVIGDEHYGRIALIEQILEGPERASWVIGNRRMGKTSLLRHLEYLTADSERYIPLYWDMQGSRTMTDLAAELTLTVEEYEERFDRIAIDIELLKRQDAAGIVRHLRRRARQFDKELLLLCDEANTLLRLAKTAPVGVARLRKLFLSNYGLRVVLASRKTRCNINGTEDDAEAAAFLADFGQRTLGRLSDQATSDLIRQTQDDWPVEANQELVLEIAHYANNHPYLTQMLCSRLFASDGRLRPVNASDLALDSTLRGYLDNDFCCLSSDERRVMLSVAQGNNTITAMITDTGLSPVVVQEHVYGMERQGLLRQTSAGFRPGNEFLRQWLQPVVVQALESDAAGQ